MICDLIIFILAILMLAISFSLGLKVFATVLLSVTPMLTYFCFVFYREYRMRRGWQQYCKDNYNIDIDLFYNIKPKKKKKGD